MSANDAMTETIRIRIEPQKKAALTRMYEQRGTNLSQVVRSFLDDELASQSDPLSRFDAIMSSADKKLDAYGAPEPTVEDIVSYVESVRAARSADTAAQA